MFVRGWSPDGKQILYSEAIESRNDKATLVIATLDPVRQIIIDQFIARYNRSNHCSCLFSSFPLKNYADSGTLSFALAQ